MTKMTRRLLVAGGTTLALATPLRKPRAQALQGIGALQTLSAPRKLDLNFMTADGTPRRLTDYAGLGIVLNLWATWCVPCVREMPALDDLAKMVEASGVVVLPISSDRGGANVVQTFYAQHDIRNLPVLLDPKGMIGHSLNVRGIPTTLLIDAQGQEVGWLEGSADWSSPDAVTVVKRVRG